MIWRDLSTFPMPQSGFVLVWPTAFDTPEVWAASVYHEAKRHGRVPGWAHLADDAEVITHWAHLPPFPAESSRGDRAMKREDGLHKPTKTQPPLTVGKED